MNTHFRLLLLLPELLLLRLAEAATAAVRAVGFALRAPPDTTQFATESRKKTTGSAPADRGKCRRALQSSR